MDKEQALMESHGAEAVNAIAVAEEARQKSFQASVVHAIREVLTEGDEGTKRLLIQKIPLLCSDMMVMKGDIATIKKVGGYILLGIGALFLTLVGSLLLSHVGVAAK